mgnify:CR=1 FL=1
MRKHAMVCSIQLALLGMAAEAWDVGLDALAPEREWLSFGR